MSSNKITALLVPVIATINSLLVLSLYSTWLLLCCYSAYTNNLFIYCTYFICLYLPYPTLPCKPTCSPCPPPTLAHFSHSVLLVKLPGAIPPLYGLSLPHYSLPTPNCCIAGWSQLPVNHRASGGCPKFYFYPILRVPTCTVGYPTTSSAVCLC